MGSRGGSKGRKYRTVQIEGFEVLVGKGAQDNDHLTLQVAEPQDFWLHVAEYPGSHVVVRNPDDLFELPRSPLRKAAQLAAFHSKARGSRGKVDVHYCQAGDVKKPRGWAPGKVQLRRWEAVKVYASDPLDEEELVD